VVAVERPAPQRGVRRTAAVLAGSLTG
jgi:hypothetical protein